QQRRAAEVRGKDRLAQAHGGRPRRGQGERREAVGAVGLARPEVGVAQVGRLLEPLPLLVQGHAVERDGDAVALLRHGRSPSRWRRTIVDWLAVPRSTPSWFQRWTSPWANPSTTACTRTSASTQSAGTRWAMRMVLSRLCPPARWPRAWPMPKGT